MLWNPACLHIICLMSDDSRPFHKLSHLGGTEKWQIVIVNWHLRMTWHLKFYCCKFFLIVVNLSIVILQCGWLMQLCSVGSDNHLSTNVNFPEILWLVWGRLPPLCLGPVCSWWLKAPASHHAAQFSTSFVPGYIIIVNLLPQRMQSNIDSDGGKSLNQRLL